MQLSIFSLFAIAATTVSAAFQDEILAAQNHYRTLHSAPALTWNATAAATAQSHVSACNFELYSGSGGYGQILAMGGFDPISTLVDYWYEDGAAAYNYSAPGFSQETGVFTQLVWKASTRVGCAQQDCDGVNGLSGGLFICLYLPAGNVQGRFPANVLPPTGPVTPATAVASQAGARLSKAPEKKVMVATPARMRIKRNL